MEDLETGREEVKVDMILAKVDKRIIKIVKIILELNLHLELEPNTEHH